MYWYFVLMWFSGELWIFVKSCLKKYDKFFFFFIYRGGIVGVIVCSCICFIVFNGVIVNLYLYWLI